MHHNEIDLLSSFTESRSQTDGHMNPLSLIIRTLVLVVIFLVLFPVAPTVGQPPEDVPILGSVSIYSDYRFLWGEGGGDVDITIGGPFAQELKRRIDNVSYNYGGNGNGLIDGSLAQPNSEIGTFIEDFEDRMEIKHLSENIRDAPTSYSGIYKGVQVNRVDINKVEGLIGAGVATDDEIILHIRIKGLLPDDNAKVVLTDGWIIFYSLMGFEAENLPPLEMREFQLEFKEDLRITTVGLASMPFSDFESGDISHYRIPLGEMVIASFDYQLSSPASNTLSYRSSDPFLSPMVIFPICLVCGFGTFLIPRRYAKLSKFERIKWLHFLTYVLFILVALGFFLGLDGRALLLLAAVSFFGCVFYSHRVYQKGYGPGALKSTPRTPKEWHARGITFLNQGKYTAALSCFERALETADDSTELANLWNDRGSAYMKLGEFGAALKSFNLALRVDPDFKPALKNTQQCLEFRRTRGVQR